MSSFAFGGTRPMPPVPTAAELQQRDNWVRTTPTAPPFSFKYNGKASAEFIGSWRLAQTTRRLDTSREERTLAYTDPATGLEARCVTVTYSSYPTVEWTLHLCNTSGTTTPLIEDVRTIDTKFERGNEGEFLLHNFLGSIVARNDYEPQESRLDAGSMKRFAPAGGRPTDAHMPYYNIEWGGGGAIFVLSWAGQWFSEFARDKGTGLAVRGGQELTKFVLRPGEEVRQPMALLQFYKGDWLRAQNVWRRYMLAHNTPKMGGKPLQPMVSICNGNHFEGLMGSAEKELFFLKKYVEEGVHADNWWCDAGWYPCHGAHWTKTGTWEVDKTRFPKGLREVSDYCRANGMKTILWFEPERVAGGTWLAENHPEWIHRTDVANGELLRLGDPDCWNWVVDRIDGIIKSEGVDVYRQDFNTDPLPAWRAADEPNRRGITEIRHVERYYALWDELLRRNPGLLIDSCASGGRRNDLETLRRAVPLLRSDHLFDAVGEQCHTYGISFWIPYNGTGVLVPDPYLARACMVAEFTLGCDVRRKDLDWETLRKLVRECREVQPYVLGDYYPLTSYNQGVDAWMAWQFDRPDLRSGIVQVFRREESPYETARLPLSALDDGATYDVKDADNPVTMTLSGRELVEHGLAVAMEKRPGAKTFTYRKRN